MQLALALLWPQPEVLSATVLGGITHPGPLILVFVFWADVSQTLYRDSSIPFSPAEYSTTLCGGHTEPSKARV